MKTSLQESRETLGVRRGQEFCLRLDRFLSLTKESEKCDDHGDRKKNASVACSYWIVVPG